MDAEQQTDEIMDINPMNMDEPWDNKENVVVRSMVGDPNRYTPLVKHTPIASPTKSLSSMYTLETRYQPIPERVLPKPTEKPRAFHLEAEPIEESPIHNETFERETTPSILLQRKVLTQPIIYSIPDAKIDQPIIINQIPPTPTVYAVTGRPRRPTIDTNVDNYEVTTPVIPKSPVIYSLIGSPRSLKQIPDPSPQSLSPLPNLYSLVGSPRIQNPTPKSSPKQTIKSSPNIFSIVGNPARTSRGVQVSPINPIEPTPILYTLINNGPPPPINKPKENYSLLNRNQSIDATMYTLANPPIIYHELQQIRRPTIYALANKPNSPPQENRSKPPARKKTPPPPPMTTRRVSRTLERKPEAINEEIIPYTTAKPRPPPQPKPQTVPKAELILIPLNEEPRRSRQPPSYTIPEQTNRKPYTATQNQPIQLSDYHTPYAYRTHKPYRERKHNNNPLPVVTHTHSERKPRPPLYEPRYRVERHHPYVPLQHTSLERYPVNTKRRSDIWNDGYQTQTDDDEEYEQRMKKKKLIYHSKRPRKPWIPVW